jgi:hypothetical protein
MFDNLREASGGSDRFEDENQGYTRTSRARSGRVFGMTAGQRFVISILLFLTVIVMGIMCLLVTGRVFL